MKKLFAIACTWWKPIPMGMNLQTNLHWGTHESMEDARRQAIAVGAEKFPEHKLSHVCACEIPATIIEEV